MTSPMICCRCARFSVIDAVCVTRLEMFPDSPWKIWMIDAVNSFTWCGVSAANRGWKPLKMPVRSSAGAVRDTGICAPGDSGVPGVEPGSSAINCWPRRFA